MKALGLGVILLGVVACSGDATGPGSTSPLYPDAERVAWNHADSLLPVLWGQMEKCSGLEGTFSYNEIAFYNVPRDNFPYQSGADTGTALGLWVPSRRQIYVARLDRVGGDARIQRTTKHEIMHALLYPIHGHPKEWFETGPCGNLIEDPHESPYGAAVLFNR